MSDNKPEENVSSQMVDLLRDYNENMKSQTTTIGNLTSEVRNFGKLQGEQGAMLKDHSEKIRVIELKQAGCRANSRIDAAKSQIKGLWKNIARIDNRLDGNEENSKLINLRAQQMQAAATAEMTLQHDAVTLKAAFLKMLPVLIIALLLGAFIAGGLFFWKIGLVDIKPSVQIKVDDDKASQNK